MLCYGTFEFQFYLKTIMRPVKMLSIHEDEREHRETWIET
jgi:hypothetical protein